MSLFESGESTGQVSLARLLEGEAPAGRSDLAPLDYVDLAVRGGWPALRDADARTARRFVNGYLGTLVEHDLLDPGVPQLNAPGGMRTAPSEHETGR